MKHMYMIEMPKTPEEARAVFEKDHQQLTEHLSDPAHREANLQAAMRAVAMLEVLQKQHAKRGLSLRPALQQYGDILSRWLASYGMQMITEEIDAPTMAEARELGFRRIRELGGAPDDLTMVPHRSDSNA